MGGSVGTTLPREMVERLKVQPGDELFAVETEDGILLTPYDPDFERSMKLYERFGRKYRNALRELA
jgi:putative addiction module antidote